MTFTVPLWLWEIVFTMVVFVGAIFTLVCAVFAFLTAIRQTSYWIEKIGVHFGVWLDITRFIRWKRDQKAPHPELAEWKERTGKAESDCATAVWKWQELVRAATIIVDGTRPDGSMADAAVHSELSYALDHYGGTWRSPAACPHNSVNYMGSIGGNACNNCGKAMEPPDPLESCR